ncbi:P-loop containing nucleoside triphosphate hydrolase protein [Amylocarpus encephaloides]|uniref:P-loop containing nucleoside triphosphate hydrolase protein n=1 Tax=Amylocarpus encephaloides TaxID=45428 RepID=A0A9P7YS51_9HELO|nr:P-loop containing nucleoside triphosphate hydrolase protein [Amylocarpus encephaloides]
MDPARALSKEDETGAPTVVPSDNETSTKSPEVIDVPKDEDKLVDYSSKAKNKTEFKHYFRIFAFSNTLDKVLLLVAAFGQIGVGVTLPLMNIVFGKLVGSFSDFFIPSSTVTKEQFLRSINQQTLYIVYLFIGRWVLSYFSMFVFRVAGIRMSAGIRYAYLKAIFALPISVIDTLPTGQASNTITTTANVLQIGISEKLGIIIQCVSLMVAAIIVAFVYSALLTVVTASIILFLALVYGIVVPIIIKMAKETEHADEKAASIAGEVLGSIRMIIACGAEQRIAKKYSGWIEESRKRAIKIGPLMGIQFAPLFFAIYTTMALCFWFGFKLFLEGRIDSVGTIVIVLMSVMMVSFGISQTAAPVIAVGKSASAATDFFAVIDAPKPNTTGFKDPEVSALDNIEFENITFAYPSRPHSKVLDDLSMRFEAGKITAIVGASGSGKSTIVGLLERWYGLDNDAIFKLPESVMIDEKEKKKKEEEEKAAKTTPKVEEPEEPKVRLGGKILVGAHNLDSIELKWWRSQIGLVQQEPFIFNDTIAKNVEYGLIGSEWENEDAATKRKLVEEACQEAFADEYINRLPLGYETSVGDAGIKLSGGQRQRLAIARSIIKRPKILILDEATSAIDVRGERLVQAALDRVSTGRTTITIAHRLSTIMKADKIVVLRKGRVIETGTHDSLLSDENGAYWALVNAQKLTMGERYADENEMTESHKLGNVLSREMSNVKAEEEVVYKNKGFFASFGLLIVEQKQRWFLYLVLTIGCIGAGSGNPIQAYLFAKILTVTASSGAALQAASNHWALMFFILGLGIGVAYYILGHSSSNISAHIACTYRQQYFESILAKPVSFYDAEENSSGTLTARVANDPTQLQQLLGINMGIVYVAVMSLIGCIIIAFVFGWKLSLVAVFVTMPIILTCSYLRLRYEVQFEAMNNRVFAESSKFASESIGAFRTVTSLTLEDMICKRYENLLQDHVNKAWMKARFSTLIFSLSDSVTMLCMALTFYYGGRLLASREYDPTQFFVVYMAIIQGSESSGSLLSFGPNMAQAAAAANRILSFRIRPKDVADEELEMKDTEGGVQIELRDMWFKYPTRDIPIFQGLNLTIEKGQFAALVGPSGCGKTSVISLLEKFYPLQKGKILCNGLDIASLSSAKYRQNMSLVSQEPTLFQGTIRENILLGVPEDTPVEALHAACRDAEIHDFITSLPDGYNTDVGTRGIALSGGQKQRISIARALIRNPKILLLDEATSSLDSESEKLVQAAFERAGKGRTMVVVAHRLATVQRADVIFVLGEGKVLERGRHDELVGKRGVYWEMCQSQALDR